MQKSPSVEGSFPAVLFQAAIKHFSACTHFQH